MELNPEIWGPHYWFFLHSIALNYPNYPNNITKKKYYEFFQNLPLFIPVESISNDFIKLLDLYPISSYLDNKKSLITWVHFIHNKINEKLEKPKISLDEFYFNYYQHYKPKIIQNKENEKFKQKIIYFIIIFLLIILIYIFYNK